MKNIYKKELFTWSLFCLGAGFFSCSDMESDTVKRVTDQSYIPVTLRSEATSTGRELACTAYIFSQTDLADDYRLEDIVRSAIDQETPLPLSPAEVANRAYRFLFVATPEEMPEIEMSTRTGKPVGKGIEWKEIMLTEGEQPLSIDNYYGITDMTGAEIAAAGKVEGHLTRLCGQLLFDFYKAGPGGVDDPVAVDPARAQSVFDRIYQIDITYTGQSSGIVFGEGNRPEPVYSENKSSEHLLHFTLTPGLSVNVPQTEEGLDAHPSATGGVRLQGGCFLPTDRKLRVAMVFHYYDPMPVCEITASPSGHLHTKDCYVQKAVNLNLPALSSEGLSVWPDYFTVHKAALPCDRVIDIQHQSGVNIQTSWNVKSN